MANIKYDKQTLENAVNSSTSVAGVLRCLAIRQTGGNHSHISKRIKDFDIDTSHFLGKSSNKGKTPNTKLAPEQILVKLENGSKRRKKNLLLRAMLESGVDYKCADCYNDGEWNSSPLTLEIDHIDGDWLNNTVENLRFLCPNCHSQQSTTNKPWKSKPD